MKTTADRLKQLMDENDWKQIDILEMVKPYCEKYHVKIGKSDLSQYVNGKTKPGQTKLSVLGMALGVSEGWLMGLDVPRDRESAAHKNGTQVDPIDIEIAAAIKRLSPENKQAALAMLKGLLNQQAKK